MTLEQFLSGVSNMVHKLFPTGNFFGGILWLAVLYGLYRAARYLSEEKIESTVGKMIFLGILIAFMDHSVYGNQVNAFTMASIAFIGAGKGVYDQVVGKYAPRRSLTYTGLKKGFLVAIVSLIFLSVYHSFLDTHVPTPKPLENNPVPMAGTPTPTPPQSADRPKQVAPSEQESVRIPPNTVLTVARQALNVREAPCSNSPQITATDGTPIVLVQNDTVKTQDKPLAYCEKSGKKYPWVFVQFPRASGIEITNGGEGWVSLCELELEEPLQNLKTLCLKNQKP